jgi:hypothetical protein
MDNTLLILILVLIAVYYYENYYETFKKVENMQLLRYRPLSTGQAASTEWTDNISGIPNPNSYQVLPNVNQYANNLAFNPNDPNSSNYQVNGKSVLDPRFYPDFGNKNGQDIGRQYS